MTTIELPVCIVRCSGYWVVNADVEMRRVNLTTNVKDATRFTPPAARAVSDFLTARGLTSEVVSALVKDHTA